MIATPAFSLSAGIISPMAPSRIPGKAFTVAVRQTLRLISV